MGVDPCAGLEVQQILLLVEGPDAGEGSVQVSDHSLRAPLKDVLQGTAPTEGSTDVRPERRLACLALEHCLALQWFALVWQSF